MKWLRLDLFLLFLKFSQHYFNFSTSIGVLQYVVCFFENWISKYVWTITKLLQVFVDFLWIHFFNCATGVQYIPLNYAGSGIQMDRINHWLNLSKYWLLLTLLGFNCIKYQYILCNLLVKIIKYHYPTRF